MIAIDCPSCIDTPGQLGDRECPYCEGDAILEAPDRLERVVGVDRAARLRRPVRRVRRARDRYAAARQLWADRNAPVVAVWANADRNLLADEPVLKAFIENDLKARLTKVTPLRWRADDLAWCLDNARRALRGEPMATELPYESKISVSVNTHAGDLFQRNAVAIVAEHRRVPRATTP